MHRTTLAIAVVAALAACGAPPSASTPERTSPMTTENAERNKQRVRQLFEDAINHDRRDLFPELVSADYVGGRGETGPSGFGDSIDALRRGISDLHYTLEDLVAEGDRVTVRWVLSGRHTGTLNGVPPSNKQVKNEGMAIFQLRDGKILHSWLQTDRLGFLQQIGVLPPGVGGGGPPAK